MRDALFLAYLGIFKISQKNIESFQHTKANHFCIMTVRIHILEEKMMIQQIGKITVYVNNQTEAKKFWTEKMNFVVKFEQQMGPNMTWLEVGPSEHAFTTFVLYDKATMLTHNPSANVGHPSILLSTTDIEKTYAELQATGVKVDELMSMPYGKMFKFFDQDENEYLIREDK